MSTMPVANKLNQPWTPEQRMAAIELLRRGKTLYPTPLVTKPKYSLKQFMIGAWDVLEPTTPFIPNWHIDAICEHLEACSRGDIHNLVINMPPRCEKSLLVSVFWGAWEWTWNPSSRWLCSSYSAGLSTRDSLKCRRLIQSPWYQREFGKVYRLTSDQNVKTRFENDKTGYRIATSVGGVGTGEGGDRIIVDDPHNVLEGESDAVRQTALDWWFETMSTRGNDPATLVRVIVMQRVNEQDLTGAVLSRDLGYEHLCLPMRFETTRRVYVAGKQVERPVSELATSIGFVDPRSTDGELLWPTRFGEGHVTDLERSLGSYAAAGQLQQRPAPREGGMFKREWFDGRIVQSLPLTRKEMRAEGEVDVPVRYTHIRYWDKAGTEGGTGARTAGVDMAKSDHFPPRFYVCDSKKGRWSSGQREAVIRQTAQEDAQQYGNVVIWMEQEPGSSGKESAQSTLVNLAGYTAKAETATGDKVTRAGPYATQCEARNVWLIEGSWNAEYIDELASFPTGLKDQVDASSGAFNKLMAKRQGSIA